MSASLRRLPTAGVALCVMAALTAACSGSSPAAKNSAEARKNIKLVDTTQVASGPLASATWLTPEEPSTLDLTNAQANDPSDLIMANVCERLNKLNSDMSVGPGVASKYTWKTPTTLVFTLRDNVKFHDGTTMTADDVLWSLKRNAAEGTAENDEFVNVRSMVKSGPNQITFTMTQPDAVLIEALAGDAGVIQERKAILAQGKSFGTPSGKDACTGPYTVKEWKSGQRVVISKFDGYWDTPRAARTTEITFKWADDDAVVNSMLTGSAQGTYLENLASAARLTKNKSTTVSQGPDTRVWSLFATERGGLADPNLRKALSLALDRDGVNRAAFAGLGQPWKEPVGSGAWGYEKSTFQAAYDKLPGSPDKPTADDIAAAKKLVTAAGATKPIVVASDGSSARNTLANALVDAAGKIGLKATITQVPTAQYGDYYDNPTLRKTADLWSDDYFISKTDPVGFYKNGASDSEVQWVLKDPAYDKLVKDGRAALNNVKRATIAIRLAQRWAAAKPWISAVQTPNTVVLSSKVTGVPASGSVRYYPWAADLGAK